MCTSTTGAGRPPGGLATTDAQASGPRAPELPTPDLPRLRLAELRVLRRDALRAEADLSYVRRLVQGRIDILRAELELRLAGLPPETETAPAPSGRTPVREDREDPEGREDRGGASQRGLESQEGLEPQGDPEPKGEPEPQGDSEPQGGLEPRRGPESQGDPEPQGNLEGLGSLGSLGGTATAPLVARLTRILADRPVGQRSSARHVTLGTPHSEEYGRLAAAMLAEVELSDLAARTDDELRAAMGRLVTYEQQVSRRRQQLQHIADGCGAEIARRYREGEAQVDDLLA